MEEDRFATMTAEDLLVLPKAESERDLMRAIGRAAGLSMLPSLAVLLEIVGDMPPEIAGNYTEQLDLLAMRVDAPSAMLVSGVVRAINLYLE